MEDSFELLSSMSPKVTGRQKHFRKGTTLLALKKHIRRSSIYENSCHTVKNEDLVIIDASTTDSNDSSKLGKKTLNETPIVISDTDFSGTDSNSNSPLSKKQGEQPHVMFKTKEKCISSNKKHSPLSSHLLSKDKVNDIELWIKTVNMENEFNQNSSSYSVLSTIYGDEIGGNFRSEGVEYATNSTAIASDCLPFHELFKNSEQNKLKTDNLIINNNKLKDTSQNVDVIIEESFINSDKSINTEVKSQDICSNGIKEIENISEEMTSKEQTPGQSDNEIRDLTSMLDDLYGDSWREKKEHVLPKTEPRKKLHKQHNIYVTNTERKPKLSVLYKNPYVETERMKSNNLLRNLHRARKKTSAESPLIKKLNDLCNSETNSEYSEKMPNPRMRLDFDNDSDNEYGDYLNLNNVDETSEKTSNHFKNVSPECESNKENIEDSLDEFSDLGESLEERIRKKINRIKIVPEKKKTKIKESTKTPNKNNKLKPEVTPFTENLNNVNESSKKKYISKKTNYLDNEETKVGKKTSGKLQSTSVSSTSTDEEWEKEISTIVHETKVIDGKYSFLASLSANVPILQCNMLARVYRNSFKTSKNQLFKKLFTLYNESVFDNAIPKDTILEWNDRMIRTAGFCYCKKITRKTGAVERSVRIVLSTKVIDAACRLRDTLIHEMCHAATWIVNCVSDGHGPYWKSWAYKAMKTFPELPPIKRCHNYSINTKYTYRCTGCGYCIGRHTKSLDIERKRCGHCIGKFEILLNKVSKKGEIKSVPATPKKEATGFALFVKENYGVYKNSHRKHGDIMKILGQKFQEMKVNPS